MTEKLKRRDVVKAMAVAGGLLALRGLAGAAEPDNKKIHLPGEWLYDGKEDQPCAIFKQGRVLLLVNEEGEWATGRAPEVDKLIILKGWEEDLVGEVTKDGKAINWSNGTIWKRP